MKWVFKWHGLNRSGCEGIPVKCNIRRYESESTLDLKERLQGTFSCNRM